MLKISEACEIANDKVEAFAILSTSGYKLTVLIFKKWRTHDIVANNSLTMRNLSSQQMENCTCCTKISHKDVTG